MKKYLPLLFMLVLPHVLKAQTDTISQKINNLPYQHIDYNPRFPDGSFEKYLSDHIRLYNNSKASINGHAILAMKIEANGIVSDVKLFKTIMPDVDKEIMRVVKSSPKWQPATVKNTPIGVYVVFDIAITIKAASEAPSTKKQINITPVATKSIKLATDKGNAIANKKPAPVSAPTNAEFPGGDAAFGRYLSSHLKYPENARRNNIEGIVELVFMINTDGSIGEIRIIKSPSPDLTLEAIRVIKASPRWKPATRNGKPVADASHIPINFQIPGKH